MFKYIYNAKVCQDMPWLQLEMNSTWNEFLYTIWTDIIPIKSILHIIIIITEVLSQYVYESFHMRDTL